MIYTRNNDHPAKLKAVEGRPANPVLSSLLSFFVQKLTENPNDECQFSFDKILAEFKGDISFSMK